MLTHLYDNYGNITTIDIENNDEDISTPYNHALPIETLFHQIEVAAEFAEAGNRPYEKDQITSRVYLLILKTGLYQEAYRDWDKKLDPDKTWKYFTILFTTVHRDLRLMQTVVIQTSFHTNNAYSMQSRAPEDGNDENDIAAVINELTNAATKDKKKMSATFADLTNTIKVLQEKIDKMDKKGGSRKRNYNNESYCWTHGRTRNNNHKSRSCSNKKDGHQSDATLHNRKNGLNKWCDGE